MQPQLMVALLPVCNDRLQFLKMTLQTFVLRYFLLDLLLVLRDIADVGEDGVSYLLVLALYLEATH
mgnify:CR=1 FL=1